MVMGRPSSYKPEYAEQAEKLCRLGATDPDLADFFGVNTTTIWRWAGRYGDFCTALKVGKDAADDRVERSLYQRANGYSFDAVKVFMPSGAKQPVYAPYVEHVPPDTTACIFWLKNRRKAEWRDRQEVTGADGKDLIPDSVVFLPAKDLAAALDGNTGSPHIKPSTEAVQQPEELD